MRLEPDGIGPGLLRLLEKRQQLGSGLLQWPKVVNILVLQTSIQLAEQDPGAFLVGLLQRVENAIVHIFASPFLGGLQEIVERRRLFLGGDRADEERQQEDGRNDS